MPSQEAQAECCALLAHQAFNTTEFVASLVAQLYEMQIHFRCRIAAPDIESESQPWIVCCGRLGRAASSALSGFAILSASYSQKTAQPRMPLKGTANSFACVLCGSL